MSRARHGENSDALVMLAARLRYERDSLAEQLASAIGSQEHPPIGHSPIRRRAVLLALDGLLARLVDPDADRQPVERWFRQLGIAHARTGRSLESLRGAFQLATSIGWRRLRSAAAELRLPASVVGEWAAAAFEFVDVLAEQAVRGYQQAGGSAARSRERLLATILRPDQHPAWLLGQLAAAGDWPVPQQVVAIAVRRGPGVALPAVGRLPAGALPDLRATPALLLYPAPLADATRAGLAEAFAGHLVAIGCPVRLVDAATSLRWAQRCLELAEAGVIPVRPVLDCADHLAELWLHAEPLLRHQLGTSVLEPLLRQAPHTRRILAETMLAWLETRGSAPALALRLGKHAQTVRYRMRRLHDIFGAQLDDTERCFEFYLVLRASMPLWQAGSSVETVP